MCVVCACMRAYVGMCLCVCACVCLCVCVGKKVPVCLFVCWSLSVYICCNNDPHPVGDQHIEVQAQLESSTSSSEKVLEVWSYEAKRLFRDRLVSEKAQKIFGSLFSSVLMSEWSTDFGSSNDVEGVYYVTWRAMPSNTATEQSQKYGRSLGRLAASDLRMLYLKASCLIVSVF